MPKMKAIGQMVQTGEHKQTDGETDAIKRIISPASRYIKIDLTKTDRNNISG